MPTNILHLQGRTALQSEAGSHNNDIKGVMCRNSHQASGGMPVCMGNVGAYVQGEMSEATNIVDAD